MAWQTGRAAAGAGASSSSSSEREGKGIDSEVGRQEGAGLVRVAGGGSGV